MAKAKLIRSTLLGLLLATLACAQTGADQRSTTTQTAVQKEKKAKKSPGAAREIGNGAGNVGAGAAKGAGSLAKGTAKGAGDLITLHPIDRCRDLRWQGSSRCREGCWCWHCEGHRQNRQGHRQGFQTLVLTNTGFL